MNEGSIVIAVFALLGGLTIGALFYGGLWLTILRVQNARRPAIMLFISSLVRMALALTGLYVVAWGRWDRLLIAIVGFMLARLLVVSVFGYPQAAPPKTREVSSHGT